MKFYLMHLMPYADLDLDYDRTHDSAWVTLPNSYYDPRKGHVLYNRFLDELELADRLGFDGVCVNEHHQNAFGTMPIPGIMAGALARRTTNCKIAILGRALPLLNNPLTVAEEFAMLDVITGGRLIAGFVRGIGAEYHSWSVNPAESHLRFYEAHDLIIRAWTETGPFPFHGKYYQFEYVNTWPRVYQQPHPPVWIPSQGSSETIEWASAPERKYTYLLVFSPIATVARNLNAYRAKAREYGYEAVPDQFGWSVPIYVAETDEIALREARPHFDAFFNKFLRMTPEMLLPPGYLSLRSMEQVMKSKGGLGGRKSVDEAIESGMFLCGSPATVRERLAAANAELDLGHLLCMAQFGTLPAELTAKNIEMLAAEVFPHFRAGSGAG